VQCRRWWWCWRGRRRARAGRPSGQDHAEMTPENVARVLDEARTWIGTPYHHMADIKGVGVDCAMLPVRVFCDLGIVPLFDPRPYPHDWMLHRSDERYLGWVKQFAQRVD